MPRRRPTFGSTLLALRQKRGLTLRALADRVGRSSAYLSILERDKAPSPPSEAMVRKLCRVLRYDGEPDVLCLMGGRFPARLLRIYNSAPLEIARLIRATKRLTEEEMIQLTEDIRERRTPVRRVQVQKENPMSPDPTKRRPEDGGHLERWIERLPSGALQRVDRFRPQPMPDNPQWMFCDFCCQQTDRLWFWPVRALGVSDGARERLETEESWWGTCVYCKPLWEENRWDLLAARVRSFDPETGSHESLVRLYSALKDAVFGEVEAWESGQPRRSSREGFPAE